MMEAQKETVGFNEGGRPKKTGVLETPVLKPTLDGAGIDKNLAKRARKLHALPSADFERVISDGRDAIAPGIDVVRCPSATEAQGPGDRQMAAMTNEWAHLSDEKLVRVAQDDLQGQGAPVEAMRRLRAAIESASAKSDTYSRRMLWLTIVLTILTVVQVIAVIPTIVSAVKSWVG